MAAYLIVGAGKFGRLAVQRLHQHDPESRFTVVDRDPLALEAIRVLVPGARVVAADGPGFLADRLRELTGWDYLLPCLPGQLAVAALRLGPLAPPAWELAAVPEELEAAAPVSLRGTAGELYLSRAAHRCPDDCQEPDVCPVDGLPRLPALSEVLAAFPLPGWEIRVIVSRLLTAGVGGVSPQALLALAENPAALPPRLIIATACRCHGVAHALVRQGGGAW
jgi:voltage-gated potassium channel Kch